MKQMSQHEGGGAWARVYHLIASNFWFLTLIPEPVDIGFIELDERIARSWERVGDSLHLSMGLEVERRDSRIAGGQISEGIPTGASTGNYFGDVSREVLRSLAAPASLAGIRRNDAGFGRSDYVRFGEMV